LLSGPNGQRNIEVQFVVVVVVVILVVIVVVDVDDIVGIVIDLNMKEYRMTVRGGAGNVLRVWNNEFRRDSSLRVVT
jgi:hypothetical protein